MLFMTQEILNIITFTFIIQLQIAIFLSYNWEPRLVKSIFLSIISIIALVMLKKGLCLLFSHLSSILILLDGFGFSFLVELCPNLLSRQYSLLSAKLFSCSFKFLFACIIHLIFDLEIFFDGESCRQKSKLLRICIFLRFLFLFFLFSCKRLFVKFREDFSCFKCLFGLGYFFVWIINLILLLGKGKGRSLIDYLILSGLIKSKSLGVRLWLLVITFLCLLIELCPSLLCVFF